MAEDINAPGSGLGPDTGFGLGLNRAGDGALGLGSSMAAAPVAPSNMNSMSVPNIPEVAAAPADEGWFNQNTRDILAAGLLGFANPNNPGAAVNQIANAQQRRAQAAQLKRNNMVKSIELGTSLARSASSLPSDRRDTFISATAGTLREGGDEIGANLFERLARQPEYQVAIGGLEETQIGKNLMRQDPTGQALLEWSMTDQGTAAMDQIADQTIMPKAFEKVQGITQSLDSLARQGHIDKDLLSRAQADGKISVPEIQQLASSMPEGHPLRMTAEELSVATAPRNIENLRTVGISLAEDFEPKEETLQAKDNIVDSEGNFVGIGIMDPKEGMKVQTENGLRLLKKGERSVDTAGSLEDTGLTKKSLSTLQDKLISTQATSDSISRSIEKFDSKFLTFGGKAKMGALAMADSAGIPLSDDMKAELAEFTSFKSNSLGMLNEYIKSITGAAMTNAEAERLRKTMPDPENDSPTEFMSKLQNVYDQTLVARQRASYMLENGLTLEQTSLEETRNLITDGTLPQRRFESLVAKGLSEKDAAVQIKKEFPSDLLEQARKNKRGTK